MAQLILCTKCGQTGSLKVEKMYDDHFNYLGDRKLCPFCKTVFEDEQIPYVEKASQKIFDPKAQRRICMYCIHYTVNPWTQKCMLWNREVTSTDSCEKFEIKQRPEEKKKEHSQDKKRESIL